MTKNKIDISVNPKEFIWAQKYRPQTVNDMILPKKIKRRLLNSVKGKSIPHYLFTSTAGTGKSTAARAIANDIGAEYLFINASLENGIDVIRTKIINFVSTVSLNDAPKVVILDEADNLSQQAQKSLRSLMEEHSTNARFILTANFKSNIIEALQSRCGEQIDFGIVDASTKKELYAELYGRILKIFELEGVEYDVTDQKQARVIFEIIEQNFPDVRSVLNRVQQYTQQGKLSEEKQGSEYNTVLNELIKYIKGNEFNKVREWLGKHKEIESDFIFRFLYDQLYEHLVDQSKPDLIVIIAKYWDMGAKVPDHEVLLMACITEVFINCNFK